MERGDIGPLDTPSDIRAAVRRIHADLADSDPVPRADYEALLAEFNDLTERVAKLEQWVADYQELLTQTRQQRLTGPV